KKRFQWLHYPVRDLAAPFDARQQDSPLAEWFSAITRGERILLHCAAGLGRTGTVAARLLMMAGQSSDSAIKQVRAARPGTVESASQERFLRTPR
ncbi:MAG: phosphatase, partial [Proteobacteria bacterium]|nr:phosphatase [Pseudomonadota bacterium]